MSNPSAHCPQRISRFVKLFTPGLSAAAAMLVVGRLFNEIESAVPRFTAEYADNPAFREWPGWTEPYMIAHPVWYGFLFAAGFILWTRGERAPTWRAASQNGVTYGALMFVVGCLPIFALIYASFALPFELIAISWAGRNLSQYVVAGACVALTIRAMEQP